MRQGKATWPGELELVQEWYAPHLDRIYDDAPSRAADVAQLGQIAAGYGSRERFLTELTLDPPDATSGRAGADLKDEDYTVLSTIHSAKGQEWRIVRILNAVDGCIPSDRATCTSEEIELGRRCRPQAADHACGAGVVEVYDLNNNQITGAAFMGTVGLNWQFSGILAVLRRRVFLRRRSLNLEL